MLLGLLAAVVIAPIGEEIFYRGFATTAWARASGPTGASSGRPLLLRRPRPHDQRPDRSARRPGRAWWRFSSRLPVALALGWVFVRRDSLPASIGLHATYNGDPRPRGLRGRLTARPAPGDAAAKSHGRCDRRAAPGRLASSPGPDGGGIGGLPSFGPGDARRPPSRSPHDPPTPGSERRPTTRSVRRAGAAPGRAIREVPAAERPRERLALRGAGGLTTAELIALIWGSGARGASAVDLAEEALARNDGLTGLARASDLELEAIPGVGVAKAGQLAAAFELGPTAPRRLALGSLDDPFPGRRRRSARPPDGPARARGAPGRRS